MATRVRNLLNGWWDFQPIVHTDLTVPLYPEAVPSEGWEAAAYLVPGFFTDHPYPEGWRRARSGWSRTGFDGTAPAPGYHAYLTIRGAIPMAQVFVNGRRAYVQEDMFIGDTVDITEYVRPGANELAVFLTEFRTFPHPTSGELCLIDVPWGCCIAGSQAGLWQDVELEWRPPVHVSNVTIVTSTRASEVSATVTVHNASDHPFAGVLEVSVEGAALGIPHVQVCVEAAADAEFTIASHWEGYRAWSPEDPFLYHLAVTLLSPALQVVDATRVRFGFREVWVEGHRILLNGRPQRWGGEWHRILLNGRPQRWGGEWCHKSHSHWLRPEYVRQWYQQIKDLGCSYARMHTFPHPEYYLDIADEMGILVCQESALHGSGQSGWETPELWPRFEAHVRRMVRRDKNHPSLAIWSVENEMRWSLNIVPGAKDRLPGYRALFQELDPTRPAYHDGDTSLWNEDEQPIISRHYGPACHGLGWWDKRVPLHSGEIGRWHYASPYTAMQWAGDEVFTDYALLSDSIAKDCGRIIELGRANEVSCLFFWNTSGLDNLRSGEERRFSWENPNAPGAKPLAHKPYESEYAWWESGKGYTPGWSFDTIRHSFRSVALVIREERTQFYTGTDAPHTVWVVNDTPGEISSVLRTSLVVGGEEVWVHESQVVVGSGLTAEAVLAVPMGDVEVKTVAIIRTELSGCPGAPSGDVALRHVTIVPQNALARPLSVGTVGILGETELGPWFAGHGVQTVPLAWGTLPSPEAVPVIVVSEHSVEPGSTQNRELRAFISSGGRALVLEQSVSPFPSVGLGRMPIEVAFVRDAQHPVLEGVADADLRFWGDDPFGLPSSQSWVVISPYLKPTDGTMVRALVDSSGGDFSSGGLQWAPMVEARIGGGTVVASQFRFADRWNALPVVDALLSNALSYLAEWQSKPGDRKTGFVAPELRTALPGWSCEGGPDVMAVRGSDSTTLTPGDIRGSLDSGSTVVVFGVEPECAPFWSGILGGSIEAWVPEARACHVVATGKHPLLRGMSNEDTCYIDNWTYKSGGSAEQAVEYLLTVEGGANLLENCPRSGLDILFGEDNATEWKRTPALSKLFSGVLPRAGGALVEARVGAGRLIFCQLMVRPDMWQFRRFASQLGANLGLNTWSDVLEGESIAASGRASDGHPVRIRALAAPTGAQVAEGVSLSKRRMESYAGNDPFRRWAPWSTVECPEGRVIAPRVSGAVPGAILMGMEVASPEPRKFMKTIGGLPNPDLQTFLKLSGEGQVSAWVNGVKWGECSLSQGRVGFISDIDLEDGSNFVVLLWEPPAVGRLGGEFAPALQLGFESKDRRPETTFSFQ